MAGEELDYVDHDLSVRWFTRPTYQKAAQVAQISLTALHHPHMFTRG